ncbi:MAG: cytochrome b/b6 domain-containing protein [Betaproteobacteria bacterium]
MSAAKNVRVWDLPVRLMHWTIVCAVALTLLSGHGIISTAWHNPLGYLVLAIVSARIAWGFLGSRHARFRNFVATPAAAVAYAGTVVRHVDPRYIGHNPLGATMMIALLACLAGLCFSGWLYTTDAFWGEAWLDRSHAYLAWTLLALVVLHVAGVIFTGIRHRENLVLSMWNGNKRAPTGSDIE